MPTIRRRGPTSRIPGKPPTNAWRPRYRHRHDDEPFAPRGPPASHRGEPSVNPAESGSPRTTGAARAGYGARLMKALRSFTVRPSLPAELAALEELAFNLRWSWDDQTRDLFRWVDPDLWDASVHDPVRLLGLVSPRAARRPRPRRRLQAVPRRGPQRAAALPRRRPLVPGPGRQPARPRRLLLARVRHRRGRARSTRAASACWPATTSSRPATSACRSSASACSTATATSARASTPTAGSRSATPLLDPHVMALTPCDGVRVEVDLAGVPLRGPGVAGATSGGCRCTSSTPTSRRTPTTSARSPTASTAATPSTGCARRSCSASAASGPCRPSASRPRCSTPTRATPGSSAWSASASSSSSRASRSPRRSRRCGPGASSPPTPPCRPASTGSRSS